ncbi:hypothetical protein CHUAL_002827 [Chamberlinius hualienensis]
MGIKMWSVLLLASSALLILSVGGGGVESAVCPASKLQNCLNMAYKFLENDRFTFPTTKGDVEDVCNSWSQFLQCIEGYVAECLDNQQKTDFKQNVGNILDSVRNLCTDTNYQEQYFKHADCIKRTCTDDAYCGKYYKQLTRQVSQEFDTNELCCNYRQFDNCVIINTNSICGSTARDFASAMLNKAMSFLASKCQIGSGQSIDSCNEIVVAGVSEGSGSSLASVTNSPGAMAPGSRALPNAWNPTNEPESMAYENSQSIITTSSISLLILSILTTFFII